jgi:predicted dehydrogenase
MLRRAKIVGVAILMLCAGRSAQAQSPEPARIRVAIVGLVHGHVQGWFAQLSSHPEVELVGVAEPDAALRARYEVRWHLDPKILFASEREMLAATDPQAVLVYTSIAGHRAAIEQAARRHIASMVEKPLSTTLADALAIQRAAQEFHVPVLVNYETTWYASNTAAAQLLWSGRIGDLRKLVVHDGHQGQNGAGSLFDFGCYGVDLATWLMHGETPLTVTAVTQHIKPKIYPRVDDEATIILTYPKAQAIIQGSWNWPFARKDMEVYGAEGYVDTVAENGLRIRLPGEAAEHSATADPLKPPQDSPLHYLAAVLNGSVTPQGDLNSLDTNVTVMRILDAARTSAQTGRTVTLAAHPH